MRKLRFGTVRRDRRARISWLDLHNLLGIVTLAWALVVGSTGVINTWAELMFKYWQFTELTQMIAPYKGKPPPTRLGSLRAVGRRRAQALRARHEVASSPSRARAFSSAHHYAVFMRGTRR